MQNDDEPVYDGCPECCTTITHVDLAELTDDDEIECRACPWDGYVNELIVKEGTYPFAPDECPGFDPGEVLAAWGGRRCVKCGVREPNGVRGHRHTEPEPKILGWCPACRTQVLGPESTTVSVVDCRGCAWTGPVGHLTIAPPTRVPELFESPSYPTWMLGSFREIQRKLPIGAVVDPLGMGREHYLVVVGLEMAPAFPDMSGKEYFALHTARLDGGTFYRSARMSAEELIRYSEQVVGMLSELATAEGEL